MYRNNFMVQRFVCFNFVPKKVLQNFLTPKISDLQYCPKGVIFVLYKMRTFIFISSHPCIYIYTYMKHCTFVRTYVLEVTDMLVLLPVAIPLAMVSVSMSKE